jgi:hypothetical protein
MASRAEVIEPAARAGASTVVNVHGEIVPSEPRSCPVRRSGCSEETRLSVTGSSSIRPAASPSHPSAVTRRRHVAECREDVKPDQILVAVAGRVLDVGDLEPLLGGLAHRVCR